MLEIFKNLLIVVRMLLIVWLKYAAKQKTCDCCLLSFVTDLFEKVVPLAAQQALTMFENRRTELVNREIGRLREATQLMNG